MDLKKITEILPYVLGIASGYAMVIAADPTGLYRDAKLVNAQNGPLTAAERAKAMTFVQIAAFSAGGLAALSAGLTSRGNAFRALLPIAAGAVAGFFHVKALDTVAEG